MAEILVQFDDPARLRDGRRFVAQACGRRRADGSWEGWFEFLPLDGGDPLDGGIETTQLTRGDLRYWATYLARPALGVALARALARAAADAPSLDAEGDQTPRPDAIDAGELMPDPFALCATGGTAALRRYLRALDAPRLRELIAAYDIPESPAADLARTFEDSLAERIVAHVQQHVALQRQGGTSSAVPRGD